MTRTADKFIPPAQDFKKGSDVSIEVTREQLKAGTKLDEGKPLLYKGVLMYFPLALAEVAEVSRIGVEKFGHPWGGHLTVPDGYARYTEALVRHLVEEGQISARPDEPDDQRRELVFQAATCAWNALARLEHLLRDLRE